MKTLNNRGVALYFVLAILLVVVILANIILSFITSQTRLSTHQVKRIQAYYAAQAGVNYALEQLRINNPDWVVDDPAAVPPTPTIPDQRTRRICGPGFASDPSCNAPNFTEQDFPPSVHYVDVFLRYNTSEQRVDLNSTVNYTGVY
ncbi:MAG: hypothetical protein PHT59_03940 [Candidatus Omnitrophica bacterium]|nr:hypothetical protein [Candidatus Omnitrophota bacterium]